MIQNDYLVKEYSEIKEDFNRVFKEVSFKDFEIPVKILSVPKIYDYTHGSPAAIERRFLWKPQKIYIREMPNYQMFFELAHEAGHSLKPYLESLSIEAEETKACLFQQIFSKKVKKQKFDWFENFSLFVEYRMEHIRINSKKYYELHNIAANIIEYTGDDFDLGVKVIRSLL